MNFNTILVSLRQAKDILVNQGPGLLRNAADAMNRVENAMREAATLLENAGPNLVFSSPEAAGQISALRQMRNELAPLCDREEPVKVGTAKEGGAAIGLSPAMRSLLLSIIVRLIDQLLSRISPTPTPTPAPEDKLAGE